MPTQAYRKKYRPMEDRFWEKVNKTEGCWVWTAFTTASGYGQIHRPGKTSGAEFSHRYSWIIHFGPIPDNLHVLHRCDNPPCVNPHHLFLGTQEDNMKDMGAKGRSGVRKITEEDALYIINSKEPNKDLALRFGLNRSYVWALKSRKESSWKHLP
jgi:HNH endonuclease